MNRGTEWPIPDAPGAGVVAVLVLYQCALWDSATWRSIQEQAREAPTVSGFQLLVCINGISTHAQIAEQIALNAGLPAWVSVVSVSGNFGLAWAYDYAFGVAQRTGAAWLLTLDHDTVLPPDFLPRMQRRAEEVRDRRRVGAIVPRLVSDRGKALSPFVAGVQERSLGMKVDGVPNGEVRAYNSGAWMRVEALKEIGGYDRRFWLDYLDHATFHALYMRGFQVWVEGEMELRHQLSLEDGREAISEERFRNFATAEAAFRDLHAGVAGRLLYLGRLMLRVVNQKRRGDPPHFFRTTSRLIRERLLLSRRERLRRWQDSVAEVSAAPEIAVYTGASVKGS